MRGNKSFEPDLDTTKCDKFPFNFPLKLNLPDYVFVHNGYGMPILLQKYIEGVQYGGILLKKFKRPE